MTTATFSPADLAADLDAALDQPRLEAAKRSGRPRPFWFAEHARPAPHVPLQEIEPTVLVGLVGRFAPEADGGDRFDRIPQSAGGRVDPVADARRRGVCRPGLEEGGAGFGVIHAGDCATEQRRRTLETAASDRDVPVETVMSPSNAPIYGRRGQP